MGAISYLAPLGIPAPPLEMIRAGKKLRWKHLFDMTQSDHQKLSLASRSTSRSVSFGDANPPSPKTLHAMQNALLDDSESQQMSDLPCEPDEPPPPAMPANRKPKARPSDEDKAQQQPTRLRPRIKTTPKASKVMKGASERRSQQQTAVTATASAPLSLEDPLEDPFVSPRSPATATEPNEFVLAPPSSPALPLPGSFQHESMQMPFVFPDGGMPGFTNPYTEDALWDQLFHQKPDGGHGGAPQWPPDTLRQPSRQPPVPVYGTKPLPEARITRPLPESRMAGSESRGAGSMYHPYYPMESHRQPSAHATFPQTQDNFTHYVSYPNPHIPQGHREPEVPPFNGPTAPSQLQLRLTPPTPWTEKGKGKQRAEDPPQQRSPTPPVPSPVSPLPPSSLLLRPLSNKVEYDRRSDHGDGVEVAKAPEATTLHGSDESGTLDVPTQSPESNPSERSSPASSPEKSSGRLKDAAMKDVSKAYQDMDAALRELADRHNVPFARFLKGYFRRHNLKSSGVNSWNIYQKLHSHADHREDELKRLGYTVERFEALDSQAQAKVIRDCYSAFSGSFDDKAECRAVLDMFQSLLAVEDKDLGTTGAQRQKDFNMAANKMERIGELAYILHDLEYMLILSGSHIHSDHALVDVRMSKGMQGFTEAYCRATTDKIKGHAQAWCFASRANQIVQYDWSDVPAEPVAGSSHQASSANVPPSSRPSPQPSAAGNHKSQTALARKLMQDVIIAGGGKLPGDTGNLPWLTLAAVLAGKDMRMLNWPAQCPFPPSTKGIKGIEEAGAEGLRALIQQFTDPHRPLSVQRLQKPEDIQAPVISSTEYLTTDKHGKKVRVRRVLLKNNTVHEIVVHTGQILSSQAAALEAVPSSDLTPLEDSSSSSSPTPSPVKAPAVRKRTASKRSINYVSPGSEEDESESPPKRAKGPTPSSSDSSVEVSEVQIAAPQLKPKRAPQPGKKVASGSGALATRGKATKKKKATKAKSAEYVDDSDEVMEDVKEEVRTQVLRAPPKPTRPRPKRYGTAHIPSSLPPSSPIAPSPPASPHVVPQAPSPLLAPEPLPKTTRPRGDPENQAALKLYAAPNKPGARAPTVPLGNDIEDPVQLTPHLAATTPSAPAHSPQFRPPTPSGIPLTSGTQCSVETTSGHMPTPWIGAPWAGPLDPSQSEGSGRSPLSEHPGSYARLDGHAYRPRHQAFAREERWYGDRRGDYGEYDPSRYPPMQASRDHHRMAPPDYRRGPYFHPPSPSLHHRYPADGPSGYRHNVDDYRRDAYLPPSPSTSHHGYLQSYPSPSSPYLDPRVPPPCPPQSPYMSHPPHQPSSSQYLEPRGLRPSPPGRSEGGSAARHAASPRAGSSSSK
ncbi:hypothetical protein HWV62_2605 [Athelia sp. TMB]|nr:hypothetical protein HWV62_2605 [Athelia sp. TMB]